MAAVQLAIVEQKVFDYTNACVEQKKKAAPLGGFFSPRKKFEPGCKLEATNKFAAELSAAQAEAVDRDNLEFDAFNNQVTQGIDKKTIGILVGVGLFMLLLIWMID